jgi:hypothetical protein
MLFTKRLKTYIQKRQQSIENKKIIDKLNENYQDKLDEKKVIDVNYKLTLPDVVDVTTTTLKSEKKELKSEIGNANDQTMLIDTKQLELAENKLKLNEKDATKPINNYVDSIEINKLKDNVLKAKQRYVNLAKDFIEDKMIIKE